MHASDAVSASPHEFHVRICGVTYRVSGVLAHCARFAVDALPGRLQGTPGQSGIVSHTRGVGCQRENDNSTYIWKRFRNVYHSFLRCNNLWNLILIIFQDFFLGRVNILILFGIT